ncbi:hypothetical protein ABEB36_003652 [Hypothenemus hampei]|uniref:Uncharacterized protein n=1 Tax=Hypothenemus hampei TaxID=57062 RepID=A0ABD1FCJ0_HYPHA
MDLLSSSSNDNEVINWPIRKEKKVHPKQLIKEAKSMYDGPVLIQKEKLRNIESLLNLLHEHKNKKFYEDLIIRQNCCDVLRDRGVSWGAGWGKKLTRHDKEAFWVE